MNRLYAAVATVFILTAGQALAMPDLDTPPPMYQYGMGTFHITEYGHTGSPVILISGLAAGSWTWAGTVTRLESQHRLFVVTLSGFDGMAPPQQKQGYLDAAVNSIVALLHEKEINQPVIVGHGLGGVVALKFDETHPDLVSGVVTVDGLPVDPGTETMTAEERSRMATKMTEHLMTASSEDFRHHEMEEMKNEGVMDDGAAQQLADLELRSDRATVAEYLGENITLDLRPQLDAIRSPVLLIVPYNPADANRPGAKVRSEAEKIAYYRSLMHGTRELEVVPISPARHFVMFDQPRVFVDTVAHFLDQVEHRTLAN